jgi:hypothetical protein
MMAFIKIHRVDWSLFSDCLTLKVGGTTTLPRVGNFLPIEKTSIFKIMFIKLRMKFMETGVTTLISAGRWSSFQAG